MKKHIQLTVLFLLIIILKHDPSIAQLVKFQEILSPPGSTHGLCMQEVPSGCGEQSVAPGYIIIGEGYDLIKTDLEGKILWSKEFSNQYGGISDYVQLTSDCCFLIAGSLLDSTGQTNYNLIKTDMNGNVQWSKQYLPDTSDYQYSYIYDIDNYYSYPTYYNKIGVKARQTDDNGYIVLGQTNSKSNNLMHAQLIKTDNTGNVEWTKYYGNNIFIDGYFSSHVYDIDLAGSGSSKGFILLEQVIDSNLSNNYIVLIRTDSVGSVLWSQKYLIPTWEAGVSIKETKDKGFIVTGGLTMDGAFVFKTDSIGGIQWFKYYHIFCTEIYDEFVVGNSIKQTYDGNYIIGCAHFGSGGIYEPVLFKIDTVGNVLLFKSYQRRSTGEACSVIQASDSGYAFCGSIDHTELMYFVKTDKDGNSGCGDSDDSSCVSSYSPATYAFGDTMNVSVSNTIINQTTKVTAIRSTFFCLTTATNEIEEQHTMTFIPNPATSQLTLHTSSFHNEAVTVSIMNLLGQDVSSPLNVRWSLSEVEVDVSKLAAGIYFLQLKSESGSVVRKFVKE